MREKRGPLARAVDAVTEGIAGSARRRQSERLGRVVLYDADGQPQLLSPDTDVHAPVVDTAERLLALIDDGRRRGRADDDGAEPADEAEAAESASDTRDPGADGESGSGADDRATPA